MENTYSALLSGLAGASAVTLVNEAAHRVSDRAPRLDVLGMRGLAAGARAIGLNPPEHLKASALAGDLLCNSLYYSLAGLAGRDNAVMTGTVFGLAAGVGAAFLPPKFGFGEGPTERTPQTAVMTVAWYLLGGLVAGLTYRTISRRTTSL